MARITGKLRDRNRFTKKYPFVRAPKREVLESNGTIILEFISLSFSNEHTKTGYYDTPFTDTNYRVLLSPRDTTASDSANVALVVDDSGSDLESVKVNASAAFTGIVDVIAIKVEET